MPTDPPANSLETATPVFVSYPKSGRTWVGYTLELAGIELPNTHAGAGNENRSLGIPYRGVDANRFAGRRIIFMHRNPLDTAISFYFQVHKRELVPGTWKYLRRYPRYVLTGRWPPNDMAEFLMHPGYGLENVCRYNRDWLNYLSGNADAMTLTYEDLVQDGAATLGRLLAFLGRPDISAADLYAEASFDKMRSAESSGQHGRKLTAGDEADPESRKVRRGKIRGYVDYLDAGTIERCREIAARYGFEI